MTLDVILGLLLAYAIWRGYRRGAVEIIASFVIFIVALLVATAIGNPVGRVVMGSSYLHPVVGFFIVFVVLLALGSLVTKRIKPKKGLLSGVDRIAGAALSGVRMLLVIGLVAAFFRLFHLPSSETARNSTLYGASLRGTSLVVSQLKPLVASLSDDVFRKDNFPPMPQ